MGIGGKYERKGSGNEGEGRRRRSVPSQ